MQGMLAVATDAKITTAAASQLMSNTADAGKLFLQDRDPLAKVRGGLLQTIEQLTGQFGRISSGDRSQNRRNRSRFISGLL